MNYKNVLISALLPVSFLVSAQRNFDIIPKPSSVAIGRGEYVFPAKVKVNVSPEFDKTLALISEYPAFKNRSAIIPVKSGQGDLNIVKVNDPQLNPGAYKLKIDKKGILIQASDVSGAINGIHTLIQLGLLQEDSSRLTYSVIEDKPRFSYRGLHLDVSRHFFPLSFVKKYIDLMALYKFNNFHWHLTDGAGWRLQIKKYPELTNKAAWRTHTVWKDW